MSNTWWKQNRTWVHFVNCLVFSDTLHGYTPILGKCKSRTQLPDNVNCPELFPVTDTCTLLHCSNASALDSSWEWISNGCGWYYLIFVLIHDIFLCLLLSCQCVHATIQPSHWLSYVSYIRLAYFVIENLFHALSSIAKFKQAKYFHNDVFSFWC